MKLIKYLDDHFEEHLLILIMSLMCILIFMQVLFRYFANLPLAWTEEIARYLFVWLIYIGSSLAVKNRKHIKVDAVMLLFGPKMKKVLLIVSNILFLVFAAIITYYGSGIIYKLAVVRPQVSPSVEIPMYIPYLSVPVGFTLIFVRLVQDTIKRLKESKV